MGVRRFNSGRENRAPNDEAPGRDDIVRGRRAAVLVVRIFPAGPVAQLAEQQTLNLLVEGSIPSGLTIRLAFRLHSASPRLAHGKPLQVECPERVYVQTSRRAAFAPNLLLVNS